jgi:hypothetical protein
MGPWTLVFKLERGAASENDQHLHQDDLQMVKIFCDSVYFKKIDIFPKEIVQS